MNIDGYKLIEDKKIYSFSIYDETEIIFKNCEIIGAKLNWFHRFTHLIFINCRSISQLTMENLYKIELTFVGCHVYDLSIKDCEKLSIQFIQCMVDTSSFQYSHFYQLLLSPPLTGNNSSDKILNYLNKLSPCSKESNLRDSEFLFCIIGEFKAANWTLQNVEIKHCTMSNFELDSKVFINKVDLNGTSIKEANFSDTTFLGVKFKKKNFFVEISELFVLILSRLSVFLFFNRMNFYYNYLKEKLADNQAICPKKAPKKQIEETLLKKFRILRTSLKEWIYGLNGHPLKKAIDIISSTEFGKVTLKSTDFSRNLFFLYHLRDLTHIENRRQRSPFYAFILFIIAAYFQSFRPIIIRCALVLLVFAFVFSSGVFSFSDTSLPMMINNPVINSEGHPSSFSVGLEISIKTFLSLSISPLQAKGKHTKIMRILERLIGFIFLGVLIAIITKDVSRDDR